MFNSELSEQPRRYILAGAALSIVCAVVAEIALGSGMTSSDFTRTVGRVLGLSATFMVLHQMAYHAFDHYRPSYRDLICLALTAIGSFFVISFSRLIAEGVSVHREFQAALPGLDATDLLYAIPFGAGALLIQAVLGLHYGVLFSTLISVVTAMYFPEQPLLTLYVLTTNLIAVLSLSKTRSRSAYLRAGFNIGMLAVPFVFGSLLLEPTPSTTDYILRPLLALLGGVLTAFIASGIAPLVEYLGGYVTDLRLIEMATLDHPLLKDLSIRAAGTWNHSMVMGMMAESAADAVGANPVVARVGAYFHDIGKMTKPLYFVENQFGEENRHDRLSPSMSALIIRSHVKEGIELAESHRLPRIIIDMIPQHHGTSVIEYFYDKALSEAEESGSEVDRNLYTYPGPKPQTKEAGILMLADGIEAAARTLSEPTLDRLQGLVQKMINKVFASGELDECELTLKDLHLIAKCFTRVLNGIHHQRIAYAEPAEKTAERGSDTDDESGENASSSDEQQEAPKKEDLKRLGL
jgi:putative nucleotidyltransferase with HDIG domain